MYLRSIHYNTYRNFLLFPLNKNIEYDIFNRKDFMNNLKKEIFKTGDVVKANDFLMIVRENNNGQIICNYFDKYNELHEELHDENKLIFIRH